MRIFCIATLTVTAAAFLAVTICATVHPIYRQKTINSNTTAYFSAGGGLLRAGWNTATVPLRVVVDSAHDATRPKFVLYPNDLSREQTITFTGKQPIPLLGYHALIWQRAIVWSPVATVTQSGFRSWIGTPPLLFGLWPTIALIRGPIRRYRRRRRGLCIKCGYNLKSNTSGVCPECGTRT